MWLAGKYKGVDRRRVNGSCRLGMHEGPRSLLRRCPEGKGGVRSARCYTNYKRKVVRGLVTRYVSRLKVRREYMVVSPIKYSMCTCFCFGYKGFRATRKETPTMTANVSETRSSTVIVDCRKSNSLTSVNLGRALRTTGEKRGVAMFFMGGAICKVANNRVTPAALVNRGAMAYRAKESPGCTKRPARVYRLVGALGTPIFVREISLTGPLGVELTGFTVGRTLAIRGRKGKCSFIRVLSPYPAGLGRSIGKTRGFVRRRVRGRFPIGGFEGSLCEERPMREPMDSFSARALSGIFGIGERNRSNCISSTDVAPADVGMSNFNNRKMLDTKLAVTRTTYSRKGRIS